LIIRLFGGAPILLDEIAFGRPIGLVVFFIKMFAVYFVFMWVRATLPRVRIDQMLNYNWKFLVPLTIVLIFTVAILDKVLESLAVGDIARAVIHLLSNLLVGWATIEWLRYRGRKRRAEFEALMAVRRGQPLPAVEEEPAVAEAAHAH
jgi:NADH-quinone oxidoreductase subunit H